MSFYTALQHDSAREEIIAAHEGFAPQHGDQFESHGIYAVDGAEVKNRIALLNAMGLDSSGIVLVSKCKANHDQITRATQRVKGASKALVNDHTFKQSELLRLVDSLNPIAKAWVCTAYLSCDERDLIRLMYDVYKKTYKVRCGTDQKVIMLIKVIAENAVASVLGRPTISNSAIATFVGIDSSSFRKNWKPKLIMIADVLIDIDRQFLDAVCEHLKFPKYKPSLKTTSKPSKTLLY